jgi:hypothetical protein
MRRRRVIAVVSVSGVPFMDDTEKLIREKALLRLSGIFAMPVADLHPGRRFGGDDLKVSFVSDFRRNELDRVTDDILDVADRTITKEINSGQLKMQTVGEYCDLMVRCSRTKPEAVKKLLGID